MFTGIEVRASEVKFQKWISVKHGCTVTWGNASQAKTEGTLE